MVEIANAAAGAASEAANGDESQQPDKQQVQLAQFNEYLHKCRDLYKSDPAMVSLEEPQTIGHKSLSRVPFPVLTFC